MLEFLINNELENILVVAIRYFGGIKLGAGGLLRAYVDTCRCVYSVSKVYKVETHNIYQITIDYKYYDSIRNYLVHESGSIQETEYLEEIKINYLSTSINKADLLEITNGNVKLVELGEKEVFIERNK